MQAKPRFRCIPDLWTSLFPGVVWTQQTRSIPQDWEPIRPYAVFFAILAGVLTLFPVHGVAKIHGARLPVGPRGEFPRGRYVLADLLGRTQFVGWWPEPERTEVAAEIERRRVEACEQRANLH